MIEDLWLLVVALSGALVAVVGLSIYMWDNW